MKTIREMAETLSANHLDKLSEIYDREGENAALLGYAASADAGGYTLGALILVATRLYVRAVDSKSSEAEEYKNRMLRCYNRIKEETHIGPWGKLSILRSLCLLTEKGLIDDVSEEMIARIREKTVYTDFVDKETLKFLEKIPTNYYHVAMECAGMREQLGFENEGMSDVFAEKMLTIMKENSTTGWMDEQPPYGRFDIYSIGMNLTMCNALSDLGKEVPEFLKENIKRVIDLYYAMRNTKGSGFSYGRSISFFGESSVAQHLAYALRNGLLEESMIDEAVAYIIHTVEKLTTFWYRKDKEICDIWLDGRATEGYRGIARIFDVNVGFATNLLSILDKLEGTPYADYIPKKDIVMPDVWEFHRTDFLDEEKKKRCLYVLRRKEHTFMLPLIGLGSRWKSAAYMPVPREPMFIETPPASFNHPFLTPEVIMEDGTKAMPTQNYEEIFQAEGNDFVEITAKGKLTKLIDNYPDKVSECSFTTTYTFSKDKIIVEHDIERGMFSRILFAAPNVEYVSFPGADRVEIIDTSKTPEFNSPHGNLSKCKMAFFSGNKIKYEVKL